MEKHCCAPTLLGPQLLYVNSYHTNPLEPTSRPNGSQHTALYWRAGPFPNQTRIEWIQPKEKIKTKDREDTVRGVDMLPDKRIQSEMATSSISREFRN